MNPGKMNRRINIMKYESVSDGGGGYEEILTLVKKVWANIRPASGREFNLAKQAQAEITHKVTIRYTEEVNRSQVISFNNKIYDIQYLININEENRFLELHVLESQ